MTDYDKLIQALHKGSHKEDQLIRLAIADWFEEQGRMDMAGGWRKNHKMFERIYEGSKCQSPTLTLTRG